MCPQDQIMFLGKFQQHPQCPAPSFPLVLVKKFVSTFTVVLSYLVYDYDTVLMS